MQRSGCDQPDFIRFYSGHLMHFHLSVHSESRSASIVTIKTWSLLSRFGRTLLSVENLFSPQIGPSAFIFWQNITYHSKKYPFLLCLNCGLKTYLQKEKTGRAVSYSGKTCCRVHSHWPHIYNSHWYFCSVVHWAPETVVNRWSRYLILHKIWSFLSQWYSKLLEYPEWSILDNSDDRYAPQLSETTPCRRYRVDMTGGEWQNMGQKPLCYLQSDVKYCNQEKDYVLYGGLFRGEIPVVQLLMKFIEFLIIDFAFCD
jgi:hypothetical protein